MEDKLKRILDLALKLNPSETRREVTGSKPTIFVEFSGHVGTVCVRVYRNGWKPYADTDCSWEFSVDATETISIKIDQCIGYLESLCREQGISLGVEPMEVGNEV